MASRRQIELMAIARARLAEAPEMESQDKLIAAASEFGEGATGFGTEIAAIMRAGGSLNPFKAAGGLVGSAVGGMFRDDLSAEEAFGQVSDSYSKAESEIRGMQDQFEEENPLLSDAAAVGGMVAGLAIPAASASKLATGVKSAAALTAAEGAVYGAGSDEDRLTGALIGGAAGGVLGAAIPKLTSKLSDLRADKTASAADEAEAAVELATAKADAEEWTDVGERLNAFDEAVKGVSDAISRKISPQIGGRVQRADETAMRMRTKDTAEFLETEGMQKVIRLAEEDKDFKGMMLDFAQGAVKEGKVLRYVVDNLDEDAGEALTKYLRWSGKWNQSYNEKLGDTAADGYNYLHTQVNKDSVIKGKDPLPAKKGTGPENQSAFMDDPINVPLDQAAKERSRGLYSKGEVRVDEYDNPFLTNAQRVFNNQRLLQLQEKNGVKNITTGADGLLNALETVWKKKGINETGAREARNAVTSLITGQNKNANAWVKAYQNSVYGATLAGPKSAVLNFHDIPVALWNNGMENVKGLVNSQIKSAADVERLGIDGQNVGEFVQEIRTNKATKNVGESVERVSKKLTDKGMQWSFFAKADRVAKNRVLRIVAQDTVNRAKAGNLAERWGNYFDMKELRQIEHAVKRTGGDINEMTLREKRLYDEILTLGLGQQQLISAAGRPVKWLENPNLRPLWMMRGFAIKHNHLLGEKILGKMRAGDTKGAAKEAAMYLALPGSGYAAMNLARQEVFGSENYEASPEEFMYSVMDSALGPATLNMVGVGTSYERKELSQNPVGKVMEGLLPPGGYTETVGRAVADAVRKEDASELAGVVTDLPIVKQTMRAYENAEDM